MEESKEKMEEDVQDLADFLENMLSEKPEIGYFGSVGSPVSRIREISQAYETAAHAFAYRFLVEGNQILRFEQIDRKPMASIMLEKLILADLIRLGLKLFCVEVIRKKFRFL